MGRALSPSSRRAAAAESSGTGTPGPKRQRRSQTPALLAAIGTLLPQQHAGKAWFEALCIAWGAVWVTAFGLIVATRFYESCGDFGYMAIGLFVGVPHVLIPALLGDRDLPFIGPDPQRSLPWHRRYWAKACLWQANLSFVGNYFWTHYFYVVLKATYHFPISFELNDVPVALYFITFAYFNFYHVLTNFAQRAWYSSKTYAAFGRWPRLASTIALIFSLACFTAFMEAFTIQSVPYYRIQDKWQMYTIGSVFYGIYFYVSFPMFFALEEASDGRKYGTWSFVYSGLHTLAATMLVTLLLDFWRLALPHVNTEAAAAQAGPPFMS